ncbi:NAD(P)/FAD-dependent oxidoreductase [Nocardia panacis]|uniref:NAD(P)/FAD-dependent oxidoreductase n=1 Tax=Nocardia panacis TaxID=2340916 RepID=A0A3A4KB20_9NOCA|nr:NAD(P)/FAD-dependent oxidoreductase [Nocardia panacis]RJO78898.1 NAD(P)/FAD-dependent oxidoreductase [Nocardia panacis]
MSGRHPTILVIGAGFGGIGAAIELRRGGFTEITILERAADLGGVWRDNSYPGAACDVPSPLYSYSYEPKPDWPQRYSGREAIHAYLREVSERHGLGERIVFGAEVTAAEFDAGRWRVRTADGTVRTADVLICAVGQLARPRIPEIPGLDTFAGPAFHSARWRHDVDLTGKRVACIGTGASAIQYIPEIQPRVEHLTLFQRTPAWVVPKFDTEYSPIQHRLFAKVPGALLVERFGWFALTEFLSLGLVELPVIARVVAQLGRRQLRRQVPDAELRAKLTPDYPVGCKRVLFSNEYFPALTQPNVAVQTAPIIEIRPDGVRTADGVTHPADVLIYGTGFKSTEFLWPMDIHGRDGRELTEVWRDGAHAHLGITVPEFPNLFLLYGPNTNLASGSIIYMIESQARYIRQAVQLLADHPGHCLEVRADPERDFNTALQRRIERSPFTFCTSWYRNAAGLVTNNWPGSQTAYRRRTRHLNPADFTVTPAA